MNKSNELRYNTDSPDWGCIIAALRVQGMSMADIAESIGSTIPHAYMIANGTRGENLSYKTGFRLIKLFERECVKKENQHGTR